MTLVEYLRHPGVSSSDLRAFLKCPAKYATRGKKYRTPAMLIGSAVHAAVEGIFGEVFAVLPDVDRRTKAGKDAYAAFSLENVGREVITTEQLDAVNGMATSILSLLNTRFGNAPITREPSLFWRDAETGLACKARPDLIIDGMEPAIIEVKTTTDASADAWYWKVKAMDYGIQAIHHREGCIENHTPNGWMVPYGWLVCETDPPYASVIHWLRAGPRYQADSERHRGALRRLKHCIDEMQYPSYEEDECVW